MALGGRICPHCRRYTAKGEPRCAYCNGYLGPEWLATVQRALAQNGLLATNLIAALCVAVFFGEVVVSLATIKPPPNVLSFLLLGVDANILVRFGALASGIDLAEPWRMLSACFLHAGLLHLIMNMAVLYDFARVLEPEIKWQRFMIGYTLTGVIGFAVSTWWYGGTLYVTVGASGAVFGVNGLLLGKMIAAKDRRATGFLWRTIAYSFMFYFFMRTNQAAHMGGLFAGIALGWLFGREKRPWYRDRIMTIGAVLCVALCLAALILAQWRYLR